MSDFLRFPAEGHAIISDDAMLSDADGTMPQSLKNDADWRYFQSHLDAATIVVVGRQGADAHPNKAGRKRLVFTSNAGPDGFSRQGDVWKVDPQRADVATIMRRMAPKGGMAAVTGGTRVFDWFLERELLTRFHLVHAQGVLVPNGRPVFSGLRSQTIEAVHDKLQLAGLTPMPSQSLDVSANVTLTLFQPKKTHL